MMRKTLFFILSLLSASVWGQVEGFEGCVPETFISLGQQPLKISSLYYKEGKTSLEWNYSAGESIAVQIKPLDLSDPKRRSSGFMAWIYNEKPCQDSVRFDFLNREGEVGCWFTFRLKAKGWRACWIAFKHMHWTQKDPNITSYRIVAPQKSGRIFIDRLTFPMKKMNDRTTPDQQMPYNNALSNRNLWHWCRVWQWEQYQSDLPLLNRLTAAQGRDLDMIGERLTAVLDIKKAPQRMVETAYRLFGQAHIQLSATGKGYVGAPLVTPDELNRKKGELTWSDMEAMLSGFAYDAYYNQNKRSAQNYFIVFNYAIDQGFAYGSGMGTNHHYGYQVRKIYDTAWLMRKEIYKQPNSAEILSTLLFWSALQETRLPCEKGRDELLDSWHTLLMPKFISAMLIPDVCEKERALRGLSRWLSSSLDYTPGTIGGIKVDGTTFHHGGFYPGYTTGVLAGIGQYVALVGGTPYQLDYVARKHLKEAFMAMRTYCNLYEWGIGLSGRHPFNGRMGGEDIEAFAHLALAGDLSGEGGSIDQELAANYLRLLNGRKTKNGSLLEKAGFSAGLSPEGFWVYNYGSAGIYRRQDWMVTLKGYTTNVWGAEIYAKDNRYGRYQSYGSVQIMGKGDPVSREASGFTPNGWDWNRLPGTTTIHLPFELLESPSKGTMMARSTSNFSGSSSLNKRYGMFAMKLTEPNYKNFTSDFVARKSVFCFDNRLIFVGSGISNTNRDYPTETTLFQCKDNSSASFEDQAWLIDGYDNYYHVIDGRLMTSLGEQVSRDEKTRKVTKGVFASAWIDHGVAPKDATYEYVVLVQPSKLELEDAKRTLGYQLLQRDHAAHVVYDIKSRIVAYAAFDHYRSTTAVGEVIEIPAETLVMERKDDRGTLHLSVCDPNLNIGDKGYTTKEESLPIEKIIRLKGRWKLTSAVNGVEVNGQNEETLIKVRCQHGQPVEFILAIGK